MSFLPRVTDLNREYVARQFDDLGPEACVAEVTEHLGRENPELLDMVRRCASDIGGGFDTMVGFGMFYQLLLAAAVDAHGKQTPHALPSSRRRNIVIAARQRQCLVTLSKTTTFRFGVYHIALV